MISNMIVKPKIFGVTHLPEYLDSVISQLAPQIKQGQKIGIEPSPKDVLLYAQVQDSKEPIWDLCDLIKAESELEDYPIDEFIAIKRFTEFFFNIYNFLNKVEAIPIAVGTKVREDYHRTLIKKIFVRGEDYTREESRIRHLLSHPHFNHHVAKKIKDKNLDAVIIGSDHYPIARIADCEFISLNNREIPDLGVENMHRIYPEYKDSLPDL